MSIKYTKGNELTRYNATPVDFPRRAAVVHNRPTPQNHPCTSRSPLHPIEKAFVILRHVGVDVCGEGHDSRTGVPPNRLVGCWI